MSGRWLSIKIRFPAETHVLSGIFLRCHAIAGSAAGEIDSKISRNRPPWTIRTIKITQDPENAQINHIPSMETFKRVREGQLVPARYQKNEVRKQEGMPEFYI